MREVAHQGGDAAVDRAAGAARAGSAETGSVPVALGTPGALLSLQRAAGNRAVQRHLSAHGGHRGSQVQRTAAVQREPQATTEELQDVVDLMPVQTDLDSLVSAVEGECGKWTTWRGTLQGEQPGPAAFQAMNAFKASIQGKGFAASDPRIVRLAKRRLQGDNRQALMEMCSFALGSSTRSGGDYTGLAALFGVSTKALNHKYTLKVGYSIQVKGKLGVGVGYTYRSAAIEYTNDFGMKYNKPLNMSSGGVSVGPEAEIKLPGKAGKLKDKLGDRAGGVGLDGSASTDSLIFWMPDDFETTFQVVKAAAGGALGVKGEVKILELVRVSSNKHPPLLFDMMGGQHITAELGAEIGASIGGGVEVEGGYMRGGEDVGRTTVNAPALEDSKKNAEKAGLSGGDPREPQWQVVKGLITKFATGAAMPAPESQLEITRFVADVRGWATSNEATDIRFEVVGQASPRWRHPKKGQIPESLNQKLSDERAAVVKAFILGEWNEGEGTNVQAVAGGSAGPPMEMTEDRVASSGKGSLNGLAESRDPDNDDAAYRVASVTAWGKAAPPPPPASPPPLR